ncbi:MAG: hypothetical protein JHC95_05390 [Solirubrobacteraceae bacterium]|nr:hypothetical protein [Solirubrobacteraceae bacterium]
MRSPVHAAVAATLLAALMLALTACSGNTCPYGSEGNHASDCKSRPDPSANEAEGWRAPAVAPRLTELRRRGITDINGLRVNRWGEVWVTTASGKQLVLDVDTKEVKDPKDDWETKGTRPIPLTAANSEAVPTAMAAIKRQAPGMPFVDADLFDFGVGPTAGVRWHITVGSGSEYRTFHATTQGRLICEMNRETGVCPTF